MFCAICTSERGPFTREPLGKNGALVAVCRDCAEVSPVSNPELTAAYEVNDGPKMGWEEVRRRVFAYDESVDPLFGRVRDIVPRPKTPGYKIIRVPRRDSMGRSRDAREAFMTIYKQHGQIHFLGMDERYVLFETPDPKIVGESRARSENPLLANEMFRTPTDG